MFNGTSASDVHVCAVGDLNHSLLGFIVISENAVRSARDVESHYNWGRVVSDDNWLHDIICIVCENLAIHGTY